MKRKKTEIELAIKQAEALDRRLEILGLYLAGSVGEIAQQLRKIKALECSNDLSISHTGA